MEQKDIEYLREQRKNHLATIADIQRRAELFMKQYQTALEHEINGVEYIEKTLNEAGVPIEEPQETAEIEQEISIVEPVEELAEKTTNVEYSENESATEATE